MIKIIFADAYYNLNEENVNTDDPLVKLIQEGYLIFYCSEFLYQFRKYLHSGF